MRPRVGVRKWVRQLNSVVFPAPLGPMRAWIVPRRTRRSTSLTATKPRNSLVSPWVSRMTSPATDEMIVGGPSPDKASGGLGRGRIEARVAPLAPRRVGGPDLPRGHAVVLGAHHVLDEGARVAVEGVVEQ